MAGLNLGTGFRGSAVGSLYGGYNGASVPPASTVPEGPGTITQQAWGVPPATGQPPARGLHAAAIGTAALILLVVMWWTAPR